MLDTHKEQSSLGDTQLFKSARMREKIKDCESLGFEYWGEQHGSRVWAVSPDQQFHSVKLATKRDPIARHDTGTCCLESWSAANIKVSV